MRRKRNPMEVLAEQLVRISRTEHLRAERARVTSTTPLEMLLEDGAAGTVLSEDDADTEITTSVWAANPEVGDIIIVQPDGSDGYIALAVLAEAAPSDDFVDFPVLGSAPDAPGSGARVYADSSSGHTRLRVRFPTGSAITLATEP